MPWINNHPPHICVICGHRRGVARALSVFSPLGREFAVEPEGRLAGWQCGGDAVLISEEGDA